MAVRIMPGEMTESNIIIMDQTKDVSTLQDRFSEETASKLADSHNSRIDYFRFSNTHDYFPKLYVQEEYLPLGYSKPYCLHLAWNRRQDYRQLDMYKSVAG